MDLRSLKLAAEMQLDRQQQRAPATTLKAVLTELKLTAKADTKSNDYSKGIKMCQELQRPVVLVDRGILLHWPEDGLSQPRNYLDWPASSLRPLVGQTDSDLDDFLAAVLGQVFEEQDRNRVKRDAKVALAIQFRDDQELTRKSKAHPEWFPEGAALTDCTLESFYREMGSTAPAGALTDAQTLSLRAELIAAVEDRHAAAGGTERPWYTAEVDHSIPCWLITFLLMQLFGTRNLGDLSPADKLWLYKVIKSLHNGFKNAMMVDTSRNQWHIWLSLLLAMGFTMDDISSEKRRSRQPCVTRVAKHSHTPQMIDFVSCFEPQSLAVDAATMLEAFHSYAYELYLIGKEQGEGSKRQQAVFKLAKWLFDRGDGARLTMPL